MSPSRRTTRFSIRCECGAHLSAGGSTTHHLGRNPWNQRLFDLLCAELLGRESNTDLAMGWLEPREGELLVDAIIDQGLRCLQQRTPNSSKFQARTLEWVAGIHGGMCGRNWSCAHRLEEHPKFAAVTRQVSLVYHQQADTPVARSGHVTGESLAPVRVHLTPCCTVEVEEEECVLLGLKKGRERTAPCELLLLQR